MPKYLSMKFSNEAEDKITLNLSYIKEDLTDEIVKDAVTSIAQNKVLIGKNGVIDKVVEAKLVETTYREFNVL
ncbi:MAG: DUF2922 domain-containing protein [Lagierella massiliensis]|nr:DUF2922 domain-containing protein [Lagierella massiliensis]